MNLLFALSAAVLAYCVLEMFLRAVFSKQIVLAKRLEDIERLDSIEDEDAQSKSSGHFLQALMLRLISVFELLIPKNTSAMERTAQQLRQAGISSTPQHYRATVLFTTVSSGLLFFFLSQLSGNGLSTHFLMLLFGLYAGAVICRFRLTSRISARKAEIYNQLPDMMDLLSVSVSAGLGFDQAMAYIVQKGEGALFQEINIAQREIALGRSRKEALEGLADRCDNIEIKTFVSAVLQADEMGASLQNVLQIQSATIRDTHKQNVEEKAQKLAIKILLPLVLFIFPVMFIVLLGPAAMSIFAAFGDM